MAIVMVVIVRVVMAAIMMRLCPWVVRAVRAVAIMMIIVVAVVAVVVVVVVVVVVRVGVRVPRVVVRIFISRVGVCRIPRICCGVAVMGMFVI